MLNAHSRYLAPARPIAPGTRTPNWRKLPYIYSGLPRNLNTELPGKTDDQLAAVFCPKPTAKLRSNTKPKSDEARHLTPVVMGANGAKRSWRPVNHFVSTGHY